MPLTCEYLVVAGGGGGGNCTNNGRAGGGGGGGGYQSGTATANPSFDYYCAVGAAGGKGGDSAIYYFTNWVPGGGGGAGGGSDQSQRTGGPGGSGGGGSSPDGGGGAGTAGYGYSGGGAGNIFGGGGGGAGGGSTVAANGGTGIGSAINGSSIWYAAGGGGGKVDGGPGGIGGPAGANGAGNDSGATAPQCYGGGGGGSAGGWGPSNGWPGIIIIRYASPVQRATGGSITQSGGYWIHTFYGTAYFSTFADPLPTITQVDNTTTGAVNDAVVVRGAGAQYTHVFGSNLFNGSNGTVSGAGVTAPFAAWNGADTLIALNITADASAALGARTLTVNNGVGASAGVTLTVVAGAPTITSIVGWAEAAPQGFLGIRRVVYINGTNFDAPGAVTVNVSGGITVSNVIVNSATQVQADFTGTAVGNWNVSVTTTSGTSGTGVFSVIPVTSLPTAGMVVNQILSTRHTNHPGTLGMHFTVGAKDRLVTHLGRWKFSDSVQQHEMALLNDQWQIIARVVVDLGPGAVDTWVYAPLPAPVVLKANTGYMLTDLYHCGGPDSWANVSSLAPDGNVTIDGYLVTASVQYKETFSALRSDSYSIGIKFVAGGAYGVVALGRYKNPGNNLSHRILLKDAAGQIVRTATVDFTGGKGVDSQVNYGSVPLFTLTTGNTYYLLSDEQGGDTWHQYPCSITPWGGLTNLGYAYEAYPGQNGLIPPTVAGDAANLFGGTDILCIASQWYNRSESHGTFNLKWLSAGQPVAMII